MACWCVPSSIQSARLLNTCDTQGASLGAKATVVNGPHSHKAPIPLRGGAGRQAIQIKQVGRICHGEIKQDGRVYLKQEKSLQWDMLGSGLKDERETTGPESILGSKCKGPGVGRELPGSGNRGAPWRVASRGRGPGGRGGQWPAGRGHGKRSVFYCLRSIDAWLLEGGSLPTLD